MSAQLPPWKWTELETFADHLREAFPDFDISDLDLVHWNIMELVLRNPFAGSNPVWDAQGPVRYIRTYEAPGITNLPPLVVSFRIDSWPGEGGDPPGEVTGLTVYPENEPPSFDAF